MNSFVTSVVIGVVAIFATTSAQQGSCGCAPQPTVIQLSCGGSQPNNGQFQPPPPPPPPAFTPAWGGEPATTPFGIPEINPDDLMNMCQFDAQGTPTSHPPGGFPEGFYVPVDMDGIPHPTAPAGYPVPPNGWDGRAETLGFTMPQPGTPHFNMLMCYPLPVVMGTGK